MIFERKVIYPPTSLKRHRHTKWGTYDPSAKEKKEFVSRIDNIPIEPIKSPIKATLYFYEKRPKSHYRTGKYFNLLKSSAPKYNTSKRDIDNFCKFVLDALNKKLYVDDSQIIVLIAKKSYTLGKENGYIYMHFEEIIDNKIINKEEIIPIGI